MAFMMKIIRLFIATSVLGSFTLLICISNLSDTSYNKRFKTGVYHDDDIVCKIPHIDPYDNSITQFLQRQGQITCRGKPSITYEEDYSVHINWSVVHHSYTSFRYCKYQPIIRGPVASDFNFTLGKLSNAFNDSAKVNDEFIKIYCFDKSGALIYTNFHALIMPKMGTDEIYDKKLTRHRMKNKPKEIMNVLMIGLDSVSRLNSQRQLPLMRKYLLEDLEAIEMEGYTKVADNTFLNAVPILSGKFVEELPWNVTMKTQSFDKYNFIWKNFSQNGYRTLFAEDAPGINMFDLLKEGFHQPPTDHYLRPFNLAMAKERSVWNNQHHCVGDRLETDIVLKYVRDFVTKYHSKPHFGFTFISRLTRRTLNAAGAAEYPHLRSLQKLKNGNLLNNTVLIYFSDHGMRFGKIRSTYVGKVEERMPFIFFVFPRWFKKKYPSMIANMIINSKRLTTPFDLHETVKDILFFKGEIKTPNKGDRALSLFTEIPRDRTCDDAAILPHWCMCMEKEYVSTSSELVKEAANMILNHINERLSPLRNFCALFKVKEIQTALSMTAHTQVLKYRNSDNDKRTVNFGRRANAKVILQLTLMMTPGRGLFEGTVSFDETSKTYRLAGDISRINEYADQSSCISDFDLRKYCFCI